MIQLSVDGACTVMAINGEFDMAAEPQFKAIARESLATGCKDYIIDLDGVSYLDGKALAALMEFFKSVSAAGGSVRIVTSNAFHRRLFSITGMDRVITLFGSRAQAEAAHKANQKKA